MNTQPLNTNSGRCPKAGAKALGAAALAVTAAALLLAGCGDKKSPTNTDNYKITVTFEPAGSGFAEYNPQKYENGDVVEVTAVPKTAKYQFTGWTGDASGTVNPVSVYLDGNKALTAKFEERFTVTAVAEPAAGGKISLKPDSAFYPAGSKVTLSASANADSGYKFIGWVVKDSIIETDFQLSCTVNSDTAITAKFHKMYRILVTIDPENNSGEVELNPPGPFYDEGDEVTLTAKPDDNFMSWRKPDGSFFEDMETSTNSVLTIKVGNADVKLTAKFSE